MTVNNLLTKENFDALLIWFSPNREEAGAKYEEIRNGLIRFFSFKGCQDAEILADETINRVAKKIDQLDTDNKNKHITIFYGFASKIYLEYRKKLNKGEVQFEQNIHSKDEIIYQSDETIETKHQCLEICLSKISETERVLMIQYFSKEKSAKIEHRRKLAEQLNINKGAMHVKIHRLKDVLRVCVEKCLEKNN